MLKNLFIAFLFFFSFSARIQAASLTVLGDFLGRIVTGQCRHRLKIPLTQLYFFMNTHWTKHLGREEFKGCLLPSANKDEFPHVAFHHMLGERLLDPNRIKLEEAIHPHRFIPDTEQTDFEIDALSQEGFVPGHFYAVRGRTTVHKVFIVLNDTARGGTRIPTRWLAPLEQALVPFCLEEYCDQLALLKHWAAYSRFSLGFIPAGTEINVRIGLVAPQNFPRMRTNVKTSSLIDPKEFLDVKDIEERENSLRAIGCPLHRLFAMRKGGATQIFVGYARQQPVYLLPLDALYLDGQPYHPPYSVLSYTDKRVWPALKPGERSHFLDENWGKAEINIPRALGPEGLRILSRHEQRDWEDVLRAVRN